MNSKPSPKGFGPPLIKKALAAELNGKGEIRYLLSGLVFTIVAPMPEQDKISGSPDDDELFRRTIGSFMN